MSTVHVNDDDFETSVLNAEGPVLVDFWAEWCSPCKMIAPSLEEIDNELAGRLTIAKMNVDENPQTPVKYGVRGIPMLMLFKELVNLLIIFTLQYRACCVHKHTAGFQQRPKSLQ